MSAQVVPSASKLAKAVNFVAAQLRIQRKMQKPPQTEKEAKTNESPRTDNSGALHGKLDLLFDQMVTFQASFQASSSQMNSIVDEHKANIAQN